MGRGCERRPREGEDGKKMTTNKQTNKQHAYLLRLDGEIDLDLRLPLSLFLESCIFFDSTYQSSLVTLFT